MKTKAFLGTVALAASIGAFAPPAQAQIAIGHLEELSGGTSADGTP